MRIRTTVIETKEGDTVSIHNSLRDEPCHKKEGFIEYGFDVHQPTSSIVNR